MIRFRCRFPLLTVPVGRLAPFESDEVSDLPACVFGKHLEFSPGVSILFERGGLVKKVAHVELEHLEDAEQCIEADLVLSLFHSRKIRLRHADLFGQLGLRQIPALSELPNSLSDQTHPVRDLLAHGGNVIEA
jgi:hypothetical protein